MISSKKLASKALLDFIDNYGTESDLSRMLIAILSRRHRLLSNEELASLSNNWDGALVDVTEYYVPLALHSR